MKKQETIPAQLNIRKEIYIFADLNPYQQTLYRKVHAQVEELKKLKTADKTYWKAVGVLDYFIETMVNFGKIKHIPKNIYVKL